jgi:hypothetical protein
MVVIKAEVHEFEGESASGPLSAGDKIKSKSEF